MKIASRNDVLTVEGRAAVYSLRVPTKRDKLEHARRVRAGGGQQHGPQAFVARVRRVLRDRFADDPAERDRLLEIAQRYAGEQARLLARLGEGFRDLLQFARKVAAGEAKAEELPPSLKELDDQAEGFAPLREQYHAIQTLCEQLDPVLREMQADNEIYGGVFNLAAAEMFLTGWSPREGFELPAFALERGLVPQRLLDALPDEDIGAIGDRTYSAMAPSEGERKNSKSPPGSSQTGAAPMDASTGPQTSPPATATGG